MCSGIQGNRQVVVQSEAFYQPNEQRAIAARNHVRYNTTMDYTANAMFLSKSHIFLSTSIM